jgi:DNA repair exonuclease SbcCD ATPase subunit
MITTIKEFHDFIKTYNIDLNQNHIEVSSKNGNVRVQDVAITKKNSTTKTIITESGNMVRVATEHRFYYVTGSFKKVTDLKVGSCIYTKDYGFSPITNIIKHKERLDLYDLQVETEEYYTNDILSHNSTISNSLEVGLFGRLTNKTLKEIPNRKNGHGEITVEFKTTSGDDVYIHRKLQPDGLELKINGLDPLKTSSKKDIQNYIENELLDMSYYVFNNMVSISLNDFKSFLSMSPSDKRQIIDKVLSLSVYNQLRDVVRKKIKEYDLDIQTSKKNLSYIEDNIENNKRELEKLLDKINNEKKEEFGKYQKKLEDLNEKEKNILVVIDKHKLKVSEINSEISKVDKEVSDLSYNIRTLNTSLKLYENSKCPTCESDLTSSDHQHKKECIEQDIQKLNDNKNKLMVEYNEFKKSKDELNEKLENVNDKYSELKKVKYQIQTKLKEIENNKVDRNTESIENIIKDNEIKKETLESEVEVNQKNKKFFEVVESVVGDKGIKNLMIANIIPMINQNINSMLEKFDLTFNITLDSNFNVSITQYNNEISEGTLSMGESKILDFCVLMAMVKVLKTKYINLNVLFLDEIFASLDSDNTNIVIRILKEFSRETAMNIFLIHHANLERNLFDNYISVKKTNGFSDMEYIENF